MNTEAFEIAKVLLGVIAGGAGAIFFQKFRKTDEQIEKEKEIKDIQSIKCTARYSQPDDESNIESEPIAIDRLDSFQHHVIGSSDKLVYEAISVDTSLCSWNTRTQVNFSDLYLDEYGDDRERLKKLYEAAFLSLEQKLNDAMEVDPVLNITIRNNSKTGLLITGLAVTTIAAWTIPKAARYTRVIQNTRVFDIKIKPEFEYSFLDIDSLEVEPDGIWRFQLRLLDFGWQWNETLIAVGVQCGRHGLVESKPILLGTI